MDYEVLWSILIAGFFIFFLPYFAIKKIRETSKLKKESKLLKLRLGSLEHDLDQQRSENKDLSSRIKRLAKFEGVLDARAELKKVQGKIAKADSEARGIISNASAQAVEIVNLAQQRAESVAGKALIAMQSSENFALTEKAIRNKIKGYGDEYLVPNHDVLDGLADEYDHKEAGRELKLAVKSSRSMIELGTAADCDYVDAERRRGAIEFVLDAFNGKVDSAVSRVKHDNYGKLAQEIKDGFQLINANGTSFRNAHITDLYLHSRLRELKWAVAVSELKLQEREEQRAIREQMREEEKARRELEKAVKEAEREEQLLQKAMEKARKELAEASAEERAKFEGQLASLEDKLREAEEKGQRAVSMAQQTRRGYVYVISNVGSFGENVYKIGMTRRLEPMDRVNELGDASVPFPFDVHAIINVEDAPTLENELHKSFDYARRNKVNLRKEFFDVSLAEIRQVVEQRNIEAHWTMKAEAAEYRESRAIRQKEAASGEVLGSPA